MSITINFPIFPMRKEIAARRLRLGRTLVPLAGTLDPARSEQRYSSEALEFDVTGIARRPQGSPIPR